MAHDAPSTAIVEVSYSDVVVAHPQISPELAEQYAIREAELFTTATIRPAGWSWDNFDESCVQLDQWLEAQLTAAHATQTPA